jgi:hypothetical protein
MLLLGERIFMCGSSLKQYGKKNYALDGHVILSFYCHTDGMGTSLFYPSCQHHELKSLFHDSS